jgi:tight adherence protein B
MLVPILIVLSITASTYAAMRAGANKKRRELAKRLESTAEPFGIPAPVKKKGKSIFGAMDGAIRGFSISGSIKRELNRANWSLKVSEFIVIIILSASFIPLLVLLAFNKTTLTWFLVAAGTAAPVIYLKRRQAARRKLFAEQLLDAISLISNSLKSGYSFLQSIDLVARELAPPISEEFQKVLQEIKLGIPFEQAVNELLERVENDDLDLVMTSVNIQRQVGGNLSEILDRIAFTIRDRIRIKGQIRTLTAQGRMSGMILSLLPVALGLFLFFVNPDYLALLFNRPIGRILLVAAAFMQAMGIILVRKIVDIKV